jgi:hypothetical protein
MLGVAEQRLGWPSREVEDDKSKEIPSEFGYDDVSESL